jgi:hypothetical protein
VIARGLAALALALGLTACSTLAPPPRGGEAMAGRLFVRV